MKDADRWTALFSRNADQRAWEAHVRRIDEQLHSFLQFEPGVTLEATGASAASGRDGDRGEDAPQGSEDEDGALRGVPFAVKDNIAVRPFRLTCGSRLLSSFVTPYTATAVERLQAAGAVPVGKTNL